MGSRFWQTLRLGLKSLLLHKLRSGLAILGIFIGVTAVIWLVAMGEGVSYQAQQQIKELGANNIIVRSTKPPSDVTRGGGFIIAYGLLRDDYDRIVANVPTLLQAVPMREIRKEARYLDKVTDVAVVGCTAKYLEMNNLRMSRGRFLSDKDMEGGDNVAVIADTTARELFPYEDPIGQSVQIEKDFYVIVGQTESKTPSGGIGGSLAAKDYNLDIYIPLSTLQRRIGDQVITSRAGSREGEKVELSQITATVHDLSEVDETAEVIKKLLQRSHPNVDYTIVVPKELLQQAQVLQMMFNLLLVLIAGIALLVGGIGIMNIMLATVTERTREIGIRRALGAKQRDIVSQFLSETVVLSATGGLAGRVLRVSLPSGDRRHAGRDASVVSRRDRLAALEHPAVGAADRALVDRGGVLDLGGRGRGVRLVSGPARRADGPHRGVKARIAQAHDEESHPMKMAARVIDVHKDYHLKGGVVVRALRGVSIDFPEGDFVAIMGAVGLGQEHAVEPARLPGSGHAGPIHAGRPGRLATERRRAVGNPQPQPGLHLPVVQPGRAVDGRREHRAAALLPGQHLAPSPRALHRDGRNGRPGRSARPPAVSTLRRSAATRGHRPGPGQQSARDPGRRADGQPGFGHRRRDFAGARSAQRRRQDHHHGDPRAGHRGPGPSHPAHARRRARPPRGPGQFS